MKKYHIILLVFLGLLLSPDTAMACGRVNVKRSCCESKKIASTETDKKDCCHHTPLKDDSSGCEGHCGDTTCGCSLGPSILSLHFVSENTLNFIVFAPFSDIKENYSYTIPSLSAGFYFIWLIPKIG